MIDVVPGTVRIPVCVTAPVAVIMRLPPVSKVSVPKANAPLFAIFTPARGPPAKVTVPVKLLEVLLRVMLLPEAAVNVELPVVTLKAPPV